MPCKRADYLFLFIDKIFNKNAIVLCIALEVLHEGGCTLFEVRKALGNNTRKLACGETRRIFEKNPMCTKLNETFSNPFQALCAKATGLREKVGGACGSTFQRHCERAHEIQLSLRRAPINERTRYIVCGSDMRTYRSKHHLECTRRFNFSEYNIGLLYFMIIMTLTLDYVFRIAHSL